ncbi:MAG: OmpH family outer membrane protein [Bacteroides sp.]|nr:OmpH family outer membrane protein [Bacteroides sp.]
MLRKIAFVIAMFALPLGVMAQAKFGHLRSSEIITLMPKFTEAQAKLEAMGKQYQSELERTEAELNKKYQEFLQQVDSLPKNIAERRQKEIQDMAQRQEQFQKDVQQTMQQAHNKEMEPISKDLNAAIEAVGKAEGVVYIFDLDRMPIAYVGAQSIDLTAKVKAQLGIK